MTRAFLRLAPGRGLILTSPGSFRGSDSGTARWERVRHGGCNAPMRRNPRLGEGAMFEEKLLRAGADPLRYVDVRFEPQDPVFDADEPVFGRGERRQRRSRRRCRSAVAAAPLLDPVVME